MYILDASSAVTSRRRYKMVLQSQFLFGLTFSKAKTQLVVMVSTPFTPSTIVMTLFPESDFQPREEAEDRIELHDVSTAVFQDGKYTRVVHDE